MLKIKNFAFNPFGENTYVVSDETTKRCVIIDAGCYTQRERNTLAEYIKSEGLAPELVVCTHGHVDHMLGVEWAKGAYGFPFALHREDAFLIESAATHGAMYGFEVGDIPSIERWLASGDKITIGESSLEVIHTPGHTPGHVCLYNADEKILFTGDTLFKESIGRTDLPGGDYSWIMRSILEKIIPLGGDVAIYPGHGPSSTIGHETLYNPFVTEVLQGEISYK